MKIFRYTMFVLSFVFLLHGTIVHGEETVSKRFSVSPLSIETGDPQNSYYDLKVLPDEQKQLKIRIFNNDDKSIDIKVTLTDAATNNNGITSYLGDKKRNPNLKIGFSDLAQTAQSIISIKPQKSVDVPIMIKLPKVPFEGVILGGIRVTSVGKKEQSSDMQQAAAITNNIAYTIGVVLHEQETFIKPKISLKTIQSEQRNGRNYIGAQLENSAPRIIKKLVVQAKIRKKGKTNILYESRNNNMRMAPQTDFYYGISLENQPLLPGKYIIDLKGNADGIPFNFIKEFTIYKKEADEGNKNAVYVKQNSIPRWIYWIMGGLLVLIIFLISYLYNLIQKGKGEQ